MINFFTTWLPGIISYCQMVIEEDSLKRAWIDGDLSKTSVYYPGEMLEQIFGDLDSNLMRREMKDRLGDTEFINAIDAFLDTLLELEEWIQNNFDITKWSRGEPNPKIAQEIFLSPIWSKLKLFANKVVALGVVD